MDDLDLNDLYQEVILDHSKSPRNFGTLSPPCLSAVGHNVLCGDKVCFFARLNSQENIENIKFTGHGCAISIAMSSIMTDLIKGLNRSEVKDIFDDLHKILKNEDDGSCLEKIPNKLKIFEGVKKFPVRLKCATLPWRAALNIFDKCKLEEA